jgi:hypothetical protein
MKPCRPDLRLFVKEKVRNLVEAVGDRVLEQATGQTKYPVIRIRRQHFAEGTLKVIALDGINVDNSAQFPMTHQSADLFPEGVEQLVMTDTHQTRLHFGDI